MTRFARAVVALSMLLPLAAGVPATAAEPPASGASEASARAALAEVRHLLGGRTGDAEKAPAARPPARDVSLALRDLFLVREALPGAERREAEAYFARPTDGAADPDGTGYSVPADQVQTLDSAHFRVHYVTSTEDAATPAYAAEVAGVFEEMWTREVDQLGWTPPAPDGALGGDAKTDVYLVELGDSGAFGFAATDADNTCAPPGCGEFHGFMTMDNDYTGYPPDPGGALRATTAHEFNHLLHFAIAVTAESWFFEASATWMESQTYPAIDARTFYVADFARLSQLPVTDFDQQSGGNARAYGLYVWNLWLSDRYGPEVVRDAWLRAADAGNYSLAGYDAALAERGSSFAAEFQAFAAATAAWDSDAVFPPDPIGSFSYPEVTRAGTLDDGATASVVLDHTAFALFDLPQLPELTVTVSSTGGTSAGIAVVSQGAQTEIATGDLGDGSATVTVTGGDAAERVTLAVVNSDIRLVGAKDPTSSDLPGFTGDRLAVSIGVNTEPDQPDPDADPPPGPGGVLTGLVDGGRVDGGGLADPIGQAITTSRSLFAAGEAGRVVLATADRFPDALAGAALAGVNGPILFTSGLGPLDLRTEAEIARVTAGSGQVLVLGGEQAVSAEAGAQAAAAAGNVPCSAPLPETCRFAGPSREETAVLIAESVLGENPAAPPLALVARRDVFADAITGGAFAARLGVPIVLTSSDSAHPVTVGFLAGSGITETLVLGGTAAVNDATASQLPGFSGRVAGGERTATSAMIATGLWEAQGLSTGGENGVILVNVRDEGGWQTALSASVASAIFGAPQLGVESPPTGLGPEVSAYLYGSVVGPVMAFGDPSLVSPEQLDQGVALRNQTATPDG